ncbi:MAG: hypothetical protein A3J47_04250 [Candidatus Yanofskybacteria bacterium RIFCSPHIGHO2_02_FULL_43_22]|uniref:Homing endonuclease LAGLIDADG domain-containing protein n=1 Tax=Candidatus Yanofskybacteria bacterium RIFCSPHIGHO2_02_FULL_43_22 TaxID=1802681 RepID=A0A1F8FNG1_9BACT|nr:MAG: hypothetical protein A3J47_04250 [Candidatus Yanofskybacteria bacterium RIFCSPHIGHO2_02_FULL_43_22]
MSKVKIEWSPKFAYAIGLITTDGCLCNDSRHIDFTSKDEELVMKFKECLGIKNKVGVKYRGRDSYCRETKYFRIQLGDRNFYDFLLSIGLSPRKSKSIGSLDIPKEFFQDFLRGCIDGDGSIGFYSHPESKHPQFRIRLVSASEAFVDWLKLKIKDIFLIDGGWIHKSRDVSVLSYAKSDSIKLVDFLYKDKNCVCLSRKYAEVRKFYGRVAELGIRA